MSKKAKPFPPLFLSMIQSRDFITIREALELIKFFEIDASFSEEDIFGETVVLSEYCLQEEIAELIKTVEKTNKSLDSLNAIAGNINHLANVTNP